LDGPGRGELLHFKGNVALRTFWSVYLLDPKDGHTVARWHWRARYIRHLVGTRDALLIVTQRASGGMSLSPPAVLMAAPGAAPERVLIGLRGAGGSFTQPSPPSVLGLRWSGETGLVYESRAGALGIIDPRGGERLYDLVIPGDRRAGQCGVVDVRDEVIYLLTANGVLWALRHPKRPHSR
jgi:hypothetical protein